MASITKALAHVIQDENLFVHEVIKTSEAPDQFRSEFTIDGEHPYLYENPAIANHVSGTSFLDVSRQLLKAITHLYYGVPLANRFVIREVALDFQRWAKLRVPIQATLEPTIRHKTVLGEMCIAFDGTINFTQEGRKLGTMKGKFMTFSVEVENKLLSRQYQQKPLEEATTECLA